VTLELAAGRGGGARHRPLHAASGWLLHGVGDGFPLDAAGTTSATLHASHVHSYCGDNLSWQDDSLPRCTSGPGLHVREEATG
jgi:hypothetical protein